MRFFNSQSCRFFLLQISVSYYAAKIIFTKAKLKSCFPFCLDIVVYFLLQLETMTREMNQVQEVVKTKEHEKEQIRRNLQAESRQLAALRAEMDQLRERFKSQENSHGAAIADLHKAHRDEVNTLKAEMKNVQRGVPTGAEDALSPTQQLAFEQVSLFVVNSEFDPYLQFTTLLIVTNT